ncbi:MAG: RNA-binding S4 domain-containing protein [Gallionellaceae bacterium]|jgi:ribosome-associated heat shock protein Hsp15|nr:RNA-binding S4 domain-containing protein [Gallionellaceae bacterium]
MTDTAEKLRLDKWLWAARFFKTRSIAADAIETGKVQVNGARVKPAKTLAVNDKLIIRLGPYHHEIEVLALSGKRGPAPEAQKLYRETEASRLKREALAQELKAQAVNVVQKGRPTKKDRREIERFKSGAW